MGELSPVPAHVFDARWPSVRVAIAVFLLCGAGLLLRTLLALESVDSRLSRGRFADHDGVWRRTRPGQQP